MQELLAKVNRSVNRDYFYVRDIDQYNCAEFWTVMPEGGDCEDFALTKREILLAEIPKCNLRLATCVTEEKSYHAVLVVILDGEKYVLDNRFPMVLTEKQLPFYAWHKMQDERGAWKKVDGNLNIVGDALPPAGWVGFLERGNT